MKIEQFSPGSVSTLLKPLYNILGIFLKKRDVTVKLQQEIKCVFFKLEEGVIHSHTTFC